MISDALQKWTFVIFVLVATVYSQMPMPIPYPMGGYGMMMPAPPPQPVPMPMPMPMPVPVPVPIAIPFEQEIPTEKKSTTTTTTTTQSPEGEEGSDGDNRIPIGIPVPVPHFLQIAIPGYSPQACQNGKKNCPPCPPCTCSPCTPSFFSYCSPCHQQCRCKNGENAPIPQDPRAPQPYGGPAFPMPLPMPAPPPVVIVPFPHTFKNQRPRETQRKSDRSCDSHSRSTSHSCSQESSGTDSNESRNRGRQKKRKKSNSGKYGIYRRNLGKKNSKGGGLVRPVLTYLSKNGDIKIRRRLSNDEANALVEDGDSSQHVQLVAGEDTNKKPRVLVMSKTNRRRSSDQRPRRLFLRNGLTEQEIGQGRKELIFRPPEDKRISNLSVSFQISR